MRVRTNKQNAVREFLTLDNLIKYKIVHEMSWINLSKMLGVSKDTVIKISKDIGFNLTEQKEVFALKHYKKVINSDKELHTIKYLKNRKPIAVIK